MLFRSATTGVIAGYLPLCASVCAAACAPPPGFRDTPHPALTDQAKWVSHSEEIIIQRPLAIVAAAMDKPLDQTIEKSDSLPGVTGDYMLTNGSFGAPGSRHIICLSDGGSTVEESLERENSADSAHFRYIVWNYVTPKARPVQYGVGEFRTVQIDGARTRITWTYSFQLKSTEFPGYLGGLGRWLFKVGFLNRDYAKMMKGVLLGYQSTALKY
jgi:hypothetical protein